MAKITGVHELLQRVYGAPFSGQITVGAGTANYGPTVTIVPKITGKYRVLVHCSIYSSAGNIIAYISATSGSPTYVNHPAFLAQTVAFVPANVEAEMILTAGLSYTFQTTVFSGSGGFILFEGVLGPDGESVLVEQIV